MAVCLSVCLYRNRRQHDVSQKVLRVVCESLLSITSQLARHVSNTCAAGNKSSTVATRKLSLDLVSLQVCPTVAAEYCVGHHLSLCFFSPLLPLSLSPSFPSFFLSLPSLLPPFLLLHFPLSPTLPYLPPPFHPPFNTAFLPPSHPSLTLSPSPPSFSPSPPSLHCPLLQTLSSIAIQLFRLGAKVHYEDILYSKGLTRSVSSVCLFVCLSVCLSVCPFLSSISLCPLLDSCTT